MIPVLVKSVWLRNICFSKLATTLFKCIDRCYNFFYPSTDNSTGRGPIITKYQLSPTCTLLASAHKFSGHFLYTTIINGDKADSKILPFQQFLIFVTKTWGKSTNYRHLFRCGKIYYKSAVKLKKMALQQKMKVSPVFCDGPRPVKTWFLELSVEGYKKIVTSTCG
jgi:hypothetical protein